jgi:predicted DCC family thiol-disulfide oxidoreductase YuxK
MDSTLAGQVAVYYDGLCQLCSREIAHYKTMKGAEKIQFIDITSPCFDAAQEGLDPVKIHQHIHVRDAEGSLHLGVDGFFVIWSQFKFLKKLVPVASLWPIKKTLEGGYFLFTKVRPYLPRKSCADSPYCEIKK